MILHSIEIKEIMIKLIIVMLATIQSGTFSLRVCRLKNVIIRI
jgi:hypothetical protein